MALSAGLQILFAEQWIWEVFHNKNSPKNPSAFSIQKSLLIIDLDNILEVKTIAYRRNEDIAPLAVFITLESTAELLENALLQFTLADVFFFLEIGQLNQTTSESTLYIEPGRCTM